MDSEGQRNQDGKRKWNNYKQQFSKRKRLSVEPGLKGFLCSCNINEKDCVRESYIILNEYADNLYGSEIEVNNDEGKECMDDLSKELELLKSQSKKPKRFQVVDSGAKNVLFIRTELQDPVQLAEVILKDIFETKNRKTRFLLRLIPVEVTCKAYIDDIKKAFVPLLERYFKGSAKTFSIVINRRNNNKISKDEVIKDLADMVAGVGVEHKVDLKNADVSIIIEIIRNIACIAVVPNFTKYKKYNLHTVCDEKVGENSSTEEHQQQEKCDTVI